ncbi:hypothetical protein WJX72_012280 [[Myrmecia] bisecta]|uniref:Glutathione S-transferase n=1 Tax=[Myrmecia] bisecta TaxID=41462 RepID=A0AAW1QU21_9CHLO
MAASAATPPDFGSETGLHLFVAWYCPFAQRTWIAANEKGIPYKLHEMAVRDDKGSWGLPKPKPDWFLRLNPQGAVPVLAYQEEDTVHNIYESLICNEFLDEMAAEPALMPPHPAVKARARLIVDRFGQKIVPLFYRLLLAQEPTAQGEVAAQLASELTKLEGMVDSAGPFLMGSNFTLVDCAVLPFLIRFPVLKHFRGFELPAECERLAAWYKLAVQRPTVKATMVVPEPGADYAKELQGTYQKYADNTVNS